MFNDAFMPLSLCPYQISDEYVIQVEIHHVVADGDSDQILSETCREVSQMFVSDFVLYVSRC